MPEERGSPYMPDPCRYDASVEIYRSTPDLRHRATTSAQRLWRRVPSSPGENAAAAPDRAQGAEANRPDPGAAAATREPGRTPTPPERQAPAEKGV
jgi:hypothetical protein